MSAAKLYAVSLMLDAGILPVIPSMPNRRMRLMEAMGSLEKLDRRKIKRKYRKLARKAGVSNSDLHDLDACGLTMSMVKAHMVFSYIINEDIRNS